MATLSGENDGVRDPLAHERMMSNTANSVAREPPSTIFGIAKTSDNAIENTSGTATVPPITTPNVAVSANVASTDLPPSGRLSEPTLSIALDLPIS